MRPDSFTPLRKFAALALGLMLAIGSTADRAIAQSSTSSGTLFLLFPVGAETVGMGEAAVALRLGTESVWSNPAALARKQKREAAIHHSETIGARGDVISVMVPNKYGAFALSFNLLDFGNQQITDGEGTPIGLVLPRNILIAGTYGLPVGKQASIGVTLKRLQYRVDCSGQCADVTTFSASSNALDLGAQYDLPGDSTFRFGAAVRNIGSNLKVNEGEKADPLPARIEVGLSYDLNLIKKYVSDIDLRVASDLIATKSADQPSGRFGADLTYENTVHLRGGYILNDADGATAAVGFGLGTGRLTFDIARTFGGGSEDAGKTPAYISLRFNF